jgi:hypothetical protein
MILALDWVSAGVRLMRTGFSAVAGSMRGVARNFWARYVDGNSVASKTPRFGTGYIFSQRSIGARKPPITASFFCTREVYERVGGPNEAFTQSYEDYEWFRRMTSAGYNILCDPRLIGYHYHRRGFRDLTREYRRSGRGCADYIVTHFGCPFARKRLRQLSVLATTDVLGLTAIIAQPAITLSLGGMALFAVMAKTAWSIKRPEGLLYPIITLILGSMFAFGALRRFATSGLRPPIAPIVHSVHYPPLEATA